MLIVIDIIIANTLYDACLKKITGCAAVVRRPSVTNAKVGVALEIFRNTKKRSYLPSRTLMYYLLFICKFNVEFVIHMMQTVRYPISEYFF